jgi:hypothetical protein
MTDIQTPPEGEPKNDVKIDTVVSEETRRLHLWFANVLRDLPEHAEWTRLKKVYKMPFQLIANAQPNPELLDHCRRCAHDFLVDRVAKGEYVVVANFLKNTGMGTDEQIAYFQERAKAKKDAEEAAKNEFLEKEGLGSIVFELHADATMADLFTLMKQMKRPAYDALIDDLHANLGNFYDYFTDLREDMEAASGVLVRDFFDSLIVDPDNINLPINVTWITREKWTKKKAAGN